jgi:hypothetical protein
MFKAGQGVYVCRFVVLFLYYVYHRPEAVAGDYRCSSLYHRRTLGGSNVKLSLSPLQEADLPVLKIPLGTW